MSKGFIIDTGALVAFFSSTDQYHEWAIGQFRSLQPPLLTCEAVLSETCFLLSGHQKAVYLLFRYIEQEIVQLRFSLATEIEAVSRLMRRYADQPMSLADACLVRMSETAKNAVIVTTDGDFHIYRRHGRKVIPLISPETA